MCLTQVVGVDPGNRDLVFAAVDTTAAPLPDAPLKDGDIDAILQGDCGWPAAQVG